MYRTANFDAIVAGRRAGLELQTEFSIRGPPVAARAFLSALNAVPPAILPLELAASVSAPFLAGSEVSLRLNAADMIHTSRYENTTRLPDWLAVANSTARPGARTFRLKWPCHETIRIEASSPQTFADDHNVLHVEVHTSDGDVVESFAYASGRFVYGQPRLFKEFPLERSVLSVATSECPLFLDFLNLGDLRT